MGILLVQKGMGMILHEFTSLGSGLHEKSVSDLNHTNNKRWIFEILDLTANNR